MIRQFALPTKIIVTRSFLIVAFMLICFSNSHAQQSYRFGIVPQQAAGELARSWMPILKYLQEETGYEFEFATARDIPSFEGLLAQGKYDFTYMSPYHYVAYHKQSGYLAFAKARDKHIQGILVTRKDSPYKSLTDLAGQQLAFPSPNAFAASLLTRSELNQQGIVFKPVYVSSHDAVYRNVIEKNFVAGGGVVRTFEATAPEVRDQLRILFTTSGYTPHAFAAGPNVPANVVKKVLAALIKMEQSAKGMPLLATLKLKGIEAAADSDWNDVRKLNIPF